MGFKELKQTGHRSSHLSENESVGPSETAERESDDRSTTQVPTGEMDEGHVASDLLQLLSNRRRWYLWRYLKQGSGEIELSEVSREIAALERNIEPSDVDYEQRKSVYNSLRQFHCEKMAEAGVVEFDKRESVVRLTPEYADTLTVVVRPNGKAIMTQAATGIGVGTALILGSWLLRLPPFSGLDLGGVLISIGTGGGGAMLACLLLLRSGVRLSLTDAITSIGK